MTALKGQRPLHFPRLVLKRLSKAHLIIDELLNEVEDKGIKDRIVTNDSSFSDMLSGCHLSEIISALFDRIQESEVPGKKSGA